MLPRLSKPRGAGGSAATVLAPAEAAAEAAAILAGPDALVEDVDDALLTDEYAPAAALASSVDVEAAALPARLLLGWLPPRLLRFAGKGPPGCTSAGTCVRLLGTEALLPCKEAACCNVLPSHDNVRPTVELVLWRALLAEEAGAADEATDAALLGMAGVPLL